MGHSCINIEGKVQIICFWYILYLLKYLFFNLSVHTQMSHIALANIYCIGTYLIPLSLYGSFINNHRKKLLIICFICILYWVKYPNLQFTHKFVTRGYDPYILEQYIIYQIVDKGHWGWNIADSKRKIEKKLFFTTP